MNNNKNSVYYMGLAYTVVLKRDEDGDFVGRIEELQGCVAHGKNESEALRNLKAMQELWIEDCLDAGDPVPLPKDDDILPSGKWVQRVPRSLHKKLAERASREEVSLNQLVTSILAESVGERKIAALIDGALVERFGGIHLKNLCTADTSVSHRHIEAGWRQEGHWLVDGPPMMISGVTKQVANVMKMLPSKGTFGDFHDD